MKPQLIFTILILATAILITQGLKSSLSDLLKNSAQKVEKVNVTLAMRREK